ncbi:MAG: orotidine-5'-phosphate decarboxylase [Myxococcales bacterium]|nr:MAG: orotidine-5'-phosphate decarboxylase [Myxococcales bacterium]
MRARDRLIVALDGDWTLDVLASVAQTFAGEAGMAKLGKRNFTRHGPEAARRLQALGLPVFLDLKYHDIPNTVAEASQQAAALGVRMFTVHAAGGRKMLAATRVALDAWSQKSGQPAPKAVAVTVLTSLADADLAETGVQGTTAEQVKRLAALAQAAGMDGVVASAKEVALIRRTCGSDFIVVTPGIRPAFEAAADDQARVMTPREAVRAGADYLVVGRPVLRAADPAQAARAIAAEIEGP